MQKLERQTWQGQVETRGEFLRRPGQENSPIVLLLHGYQQTAEWIFQKLADVVPDTYEVIALDAPYLVPIQVENGPWRLGYSWFFYSTRLQWFPIPMTVGVDYVLSWARHQGVKDRIATIVGYSQGGYLAPFLAQRLPRVKQVVGVHCRFRHEDLGSAGGFRLDALHGAEDTKVPPEPSQESHRQLRARGWQGDFHLLPHLGHTVTAELKDHLLQLLSRGEA